ncbi:cystatin-9-like [Choloepus didactylus]|uniref:cystatin-9-like n=1 Tax=Choloepus didactylus TaxID=27675 RepID=UPI0018A0ACBB|nr:cystatin-9-like [Choloepus didactylus]
MPSVQQTRALPWRRLLLLLGLQLLGTHAWIPSELIRDKNLDDMARYFPATMEYALHTFNVHSRDTFAYKLLRILSKWQEEANPDLVFSMELELSRTTCKKFEEDIDNCDFQNPPGNHTISCFFTIRTEPWKTVFTLLNSTCVMGKN